MPTSQDPFPLPLPVIIDLRIQPRSYHDVQHYAEETVNVHSLPNGKPLKQVILENLPESQRAEFESQFWPVFESVDGAARLVAQLPTVYTPAQVANWDEKPFKFWELCGHYYRAQSRWHEALALFHSLYDHMLLFEPAPGIHVHKGNPLLWTSVCYEELGCPVLARRYLMLATCEEGILEQGKIPAQTSGVYFRWVWQYGMDHGELTSYAAKIWELYLQNPDEARFPEWILQNLGDQWMTGYPSSREAGLYRITTAYARRLMSRLGSGDGTALQFLSRYLLSAIPGCRAYGPVTSQSTDYDVVCAIEGMDLDFRSDLGRYFICECKDWKEPADFSALAKFCRVLDSAKCRFGILFSKQGISGARNERYAKREQLKVFQDRGMVVIVISESDLERLVDGSNFITMLRERYERVRLDLPD